MPCTYMKCNIFLHSCWLSSGNGTYAIWTFVAPMLAIILVWCIEQITEYTYFYIYTSLCFQINVVFLVLVLRSIFKNRMAKTRKKSMKGKKENKEKDVAM